MRRAEIRVSQVLIVKCFHFVVKGLLLSRIESTINMEQALLISGIIIYVYGTIKDLIFRRREVKEFTYKIYQKNTVTLKYQLV